MVGVLLLSPEWPPRWRVAWPGAVLLALGMEGPHLAAVPYLPSRLPRASALYGALGRRGCGAGGSR